METSRDPLVRVDTAHRAQPAVPPGDESAEMLIRRAASAQDAMYRFADTIVDTWPGVTHVGVAHVDASEVVRIYPLVPRGSSQLVPRTAHRAWEPALTFGETVTYSGDVLQAIHDTVQILAAGAGTQGIVALTITPLVAAGRVVGAASFGRLEQPGSTAPDPSAIRPLLRALAQRLRHAVMPELGQEEYDRRRQVLARLVHDLRTPLAGLGVAAELLEADPAGLSSDIMDAMRTHYADLLRFVSELEDIAFVGLDSRLPSAQPVPLMDVLEVVFWRIKPYTVRRRQTLRVYGRSDRSLRGSQHHVEQALTAVIFDVSTCSRDGTAIQIRIRGSDAHVEIAVEGTVDRVIPDLEDALLDPYLRAQPHEHAARLMSLASGKHALEHYGGTLHVKWHESRLSIVVTAPLSQ